MKKNYVIIATIIGIILALASCTDLKKDLPVTASGDTKIHDAGWTDTANVIFHGKYLKGKNWATTECKTCHGNNYNGGISQKSCSQSGCHRDGTGNPKSPEACNTCHGLFKAAANDTTSWAPPRALNGDTLETSPGVGAHQAHLAEGAISNLIKCNQCHKVPTSLTASGHYDSPLPAEVIFDTSLAALKSADHTYNPNPVFNGVTLKCSSPFCHGNWKIRKATSAYDFEFTDTLITGSAYSPKWTGGSTEALCGTTCHTLPPAGHNPEAITDCGGCHNNIVNSSGVIIDKTKHINGKIDVFDIELDF